MFMSGGLLRKTSGLHANLNAQTPPADPHLRHAGRTRRLRRHPAGRWTRLNAALRADGGALHRRLLALREDAQLPDLVTPLRISDVIAWLDASGKAERTLQG